MKVQLEGTLRSADRDDELVCRDCGCSFGADELSSEDEDGNDLCPACDSPRIFVHY